MDETSFLDNNTQFTNKTIYTYSRQRETGGRNVRALLQILKIDKEGNHWKDRFRTYESNMISSGNLYDRMSKNNISPIIATGKYKNADIIDIETKQYKLLPINSSIPVLESDKKFETIIGVSDNSINPLNMLNDSRMKEKIVYDRYDNNGRLIEYHSTDGIYTSIIWGYKGQYPIAKIENAHYSEIESYVANLQYLSDRDFDGGVCISDPTDPLHCPEQILRAALNNLRTDPGLAEKIKISTYVYDYSNGIRSITDERGVTTFFEYDILHRLKVVRDSDLNIIKTYDYNYKN